MSNSKTVVTSANAKFQFWDIESLSNVFTVAFFTPHENHLDVFFRIEPGSKLAQEVAANGGSIDGNVAGRTIVEANPAFEAERDGRRRSIKFYDLAAEDANAKLASLLGLSDADPVNDPKANSSYPAALRPVCDTDYGYDPTTKHPYVCGYNSYNYDTTLIAAYLSIAMSHHLTPGASFTPVSPVEMRGYNDEMFTETFIDYMPRFLTQGSIARGEGWNSAANRIRSNMINSGRHIDVARLNEKQSRVGLKRLLGMLGHQILESDKLKGHNAVVETLEQLYDLLAYNASDVINLEKLFYHPTYAGAFDLKKGLLDEYPETVYDAKKGTHVPEIKPWRIRRGRLTVDSSSAKFVGYVLSPYGNLHDMETVSFMYPSEQVAKDRGIPRVDVLEESRKFFHDNISDPEARAQFEEVYQYYASIRGKNFNASDQYYEDYKDKRTGALPAHLKVHELPNIPKRPNNIPYYHADGTPSSCFVTFSTGGIHGAEADIASYLTDKAEYDQTKALFDEVMSIYPDPLDMRRAKEVTLSDGRVVGWKEVLASKTTLKHAEYKKFDRHVPTLFVTKPDGSTKLHPKYVYTSVEDVIHEDFASYYPLLLTNMSAFYNPELGEDRYVKIYHQKSDLGREMKKPGLSPAEKERLSVLRNGTKLILNSASGAGDAGHDTPIRMNNTIIAMRIIGQLFSWRIGQAQTLAGARIVSTNTDGLYSALDEETNNRILEEQAAIINVDIEPEPMLLVSKDSNNRMEISRKGIYPWESAITVASGGSLACFRGPSPEKSLAHPAIMDHILAEYMRLVAGGVAMPWTNGPLAIEKPFDMETGRLIARRALETMDPAHAAMMFQNVIAASAGSITYPFALTKWTETMVDDNGNPVPLQEPVVDANGNTVQSADGSPVMQDVVDADGNVVYQQVEKQSARALQHYNRVFVVKEGTEGAVNILAAGAWKVTAAVAARRRREGAALRIDNDKIANQVLFENGLAVDTITARVNKMTQLPTDQDIITRKINGIDPDWPMVVVNQDLHHMDDDALKALLESLDIDAYVQMAAASFETNWRVRDHGGDEDSSEESEDVAA